MSQPAVPVNPNVDVVGSTRPAAEKPQASWARARERLAWFMVAPSLIIVALVALFPLIQTFRYSFTNARLTTASQAQWVDIQQYKFLFSNADFRHAFQVTIEFTVLSVFFETILGMAFALLIYSNFPGRGLLRTAILVPWAIPTVVSSQLWNYMFQNYGVFNDLAQYRLPKLFHWIPGIGPTIAGWFPAPGHAIGFTTNPTLSLFSIVSIDVWKTTPFMALLLLAGLQVIPADVYEASRVDGANKWQQFWQITLPLLRPALLVALIFRTMDAFRVFDVVYIVKKGALDTQTLAVFAQQDLVNGDRLGQTSAVAVIIFLCIGIMVVGYTRLVRVEES